LWSKTLSLQDTMRTVWIICLKLRLIGFCLLHPVGFPNFLFISKKQMLRVMQNTLKSYHHQFILPLLGKKQVNQLTIKRFFLIFFSPFLLSKFFSPPTYFPLKFLQILLLKKNHNKYIKQNQTELGWHTKIYTVIPQVYKKNLQKN